MFLLHYLSKIVKNALYKVCIIKISDGENQLNAQFLFRCKCTWQSSVAQNNSLFKWNICMTSIASSFHCVWCLQPRSKQGPKLYNSLPDTALMKNQKVYYNKFHRSLACLSLYIWAEKFLQSKLNRCLIIDFYCRLKKVI